MTGHHHSRVIALLPGELMFQAYYQAHLVAGTYFQPVISYIPTPGADADLPPAWAATMQITVLF